MASLSSVPGWGHHGQDLCPPLSRPPLRYLLLRLLSQLLRLLILTKNDNYEGVVAKDITEVKLEDADNSISHLTNSEEIILRERRFSDAEKKKKRKKASRKDKKGKNQGRKNRKQDRKRADGRSKKRQKGKKEQKRRKNKKRKNKRKSKKSKKSKIRKQKQSSCSSNEVSLTCMKNAMDCMLFEKNQILNWQKQAKRLENHGTISTNKVGKKGEFEEARKHLEWAIGGDKNNPQCGPNTTSGRLSA